MTLVLAAAVGVCRPRPREVSVPAVDALAVRGPGPHLANIQLAAAGNTFFPQGPDGGLSAETVMDSVTTTLADGLRLRCAAVRTRLGDGLRPAAAWGQIPVEVVAFPLVSHRETVGRLLVRRRAPVEQLGSDDERLLADLARQAGPAVARQAGCRRPGRGGDGHRPAASRRCDRLVRKGLVRRRTNRRGQRQVPVGPIEAGRRLVGAVTGRLRREIADLLASPPMTQGPAAAALRQLAKTARRVPGQGWSTG